MFSSSFTASRGESYLKQRRRQDKAQDLDEDAGREEWKSFETKMWSRSLIQPPATGLCCSLRLCFALTLRTLPPSIQRHARNVLIYYVPFSSIFSDRFSLLIKPNGQIQNNFVSMVEPLFDFFVSGFKFPTSWFGTHNKLLNIFYDLNTFFPTFHII